MKNQKISFQWGPYQFTNITVATGRDGQPAWSQNRGRSQVARQLIKQLEPHSRFRISTDSFAGGSAITIKFDPKTLTTQQYNNLKQELVNRLEQGRFNPQEDLYEYYRTDQTIRDPHHNIDFSTTYCLINLEY